VEPLLRSVDFNPARKREENYTATALVALGLDNPAQINIDNLARYFVDTWLSIQSA
jgi:hypothetical protein